MVRCYGLLFTSVAVAFLAGCGGEITHRERIPFSSGAVELVITSVGGALGDERYELISSPEGRSQTFFRGANFSEFSASQQGDVFALHFCKGWIDHAEPIMVGNKDDLRLVRLSLDWSCSDKRHEK